MNKRFRKATAHLLAVLMMMSAVCAGLTVFGTVQERAYAAGPSGMKTGDHITMGKDDASGYIGLPYWRIVDKDEDGNYLFMSEYLWTGNGSNPEALVRYDTVSNGNMYWQDSMPQEWCAAFADNILGDVEGLVIVGKTVNDPEYEVVVSKYVTNHYESYEKILKEEKDRVFFLSVEEINRYMPSYEEKIAYTFNDGSPAKECWWSRSPSKDTVGHVGRVLRNGHPESAMGWSEYPARPAFWGNFTDDTCLKCTVPEGSDSAEWEIDGQHDLGEPEYVWSEDNSKCTAAASCSKCGEELSETVEATVSTEKEATTEEEGIAVYTAGFTNSAFETQTKRVPIPKKEELKPAVTPAPAAEAIVNVPAADAAAVQQALQAAGNPDTLVLGKSVKKISKRALAGTSVKTLVVTSRNLKKKSVRGSLKGSDVTAVKVQVGKAKTNKKYVQKYKKIFTKKNAGKKVKVKGKV